MLQLKTVDTFHLDNNNEQKVEEIKKPKGLSINEIKFSWGVWGFPSIERIQFKLESLNLESGLNLLPS